jgi:predicted tellurium resistance membrane protein TerC
VVPVTDPMGISPRNNFDDFYHSFLVVIQIMVSDNWDSIMITIARVKGNLAIVYFVSIIIIGVMFFLNIFLAILLENFGVDSEIMGGAANNNTG